MENETKSEEVGDDAGTQGQPPIIQVNISDNRPIYRNETEQEKKEAGGAQENPVLIRWTAGLVVVGAITAAILFLQYCELRKTDETARATNRAYVYFDQIGFQRDDSGAVPVIGISIGLVNSGNTPAKNVRVILDCPEIKGGDDVDPFDSFKWDDAQAAPSDLGPKQVATRLVCIVPVKDISALQHQKVRRFVVGEVRYTDTFAPHAPRVTRVVRRILVDSGERASFRNVGKNNCSDDNCIKM